MTDGDDELLDRLLSDFIRAVAQGREIDPTTALPDRPDLVDRVRDLWETAKEIAPRRPAPAAQTFAGYEIVRELGRGGMGQVFLARHEKLGRLVALKVLPRRGVSSRARERFLREARAVARLEHPLLVPLYDLGESDGQAFFTMQYVEGRTVAEALRDLRERRAASELAGRDLATAVLGGDASEAPPAWRGAWHEAAARVALDVADALAYAHAAGVVHRDVKPSNVMLRRDGFALLFDFGLASVEDEASLTATHGFLGTPHYASPEQAAGESDSLDGRSDVFSLGATLYELLTLEPPFPGPTPHEVLRRIQAWEPETPSKLNPNVSADLEVVCLKALEKDRDRRYATAADFAVDLRAFLAGGRVRAKRAGKFERGLRLVKRSRALTELLVEQRTRTAEMRSLVLRAERNEKLALDREAEATRARREADEERRRAEAERDTAREVVKFLRGLISTADPRTGSRDVRVVDVLGRAETDAGAAFRSRPEVLADVFGAIAYAYCGLGRYDDAVRVGSVALDAARSAFGDDDERVCDVLATIGISEVEAGRPEAGERSLRAAVGIAARTLGSSDRRAIGWRGDLATALLGRRRFAEAEAILRETLAASRAALGHEDPATLTHEGNLAVVLRARDARSEEAEALYAHCYEGRSRALGERHPDTVKALSNQAAWLTGLERYSEAERPIRLCVDSLRGTLGPEHKETLVSEHNLARVLRALDRDEEAAALQSAAVETWRRVYGVSDLRFALLLSQLCLIRGRLGDHEGAATAAEEGAEVARTFGVTGAVAAATCRLHLAAARARLGDVAVAAPLADEALDELASFGRDMTADLRVSGRQVVDALAAAGRAAAAESIRARLGT